jgi:hypothetical protein
MDAQKMDEIFAGGSLPMAESHPLPLSLAFMTLSVGEEWWDDRLIGKSSEGSNLGLTMA